MFTGIIETTGTVTSIQQEGENTVFWVGSPIAGDLKPDQSLSHNGVCLTVEALKPGFHRVTAIAETLKKTNLGAWKVGSLVNLERCMPLNGRLDGHIVQGHADDIAICTSISDKVGSWELSFRFSPHFRNLVIEKGSVTLNGISLTLFNVGDDHFSVAIIPYTYQHTNISQLKKGDSVNIEFDVIGKYVERMMGKKV